MIAKTTVILFDIVSPHYYFKGKLIFCKHYPKFFRNCIHKFKFLASTGKSLGKKYSSLLNNSLTQELGERLVGSADLVFPLHSSLGALAPMNHC
ncbi:hypothetical protein STRCR_1029 [Streptococcus criceti HS-6]|uniref:Uncharacterized protein n=1 Tax=Streptococcus criceti HS-6 TaxID=873449 RepID=G5JT61_STRCG|nr:hypothetical protein STRCR_1029 [Streptococcus criceti HS-6]